MDLKDLELFLDAIDRALAADVITDAYARAVYKTVLHYHRDNAVDDFDTIYYSNMRKYSFNSRRE